jgi:hypothetical protein
MGIDAQRYFKDTSKVLNNKIKLGHHSKVVR